MRTIRDLLLFYAMAAVLVLGIGTNTMGCKAVPPVNPVERIEAPLLSGQNHVQAADEQLAKNPPAVPQARVELKAADKDLTQASKETKAVKDEVGGVIAKLTDLQKENKALKESFFSPKQKHLFWFGIGISVLLGILAAVGNVRPGWYSLPALWAIKAVRFVLFAGIPHVVSVIRWLIKEVESFRKPKVDTVPAPAIVPV
jgi:hypothetical protein